MKVYLYTDDHVDNVGAARDYVYTVGTEGLVWAAGALELAEDYARKHEGCLWLLTFGRGYQDGVMVKAHHFEADYEMVYEQTVTVSRTIRAIDEDDAMVKMRAYVEDLEFEDNPDGNVEMDDEIRLNE